MDRIAFADESGTHGSTVCYGIGVVSIDSARQSGFVDVFERLRSKHNVSHELKWSSVRNRYGDVNLILDWIDAILRSDTGAFDIIVVNTSLYRKWSRRNASREDAFYTTYTMLLTHMADRSTSLSEVLIDDRSDSYPLQHEAMEIIGNRMLHALTSTGRLNNVRKCSSLHTPGIQVADILTGLVVSAHTRALRPETPLNIGKRLAIARAAHMLGWDHLHYDTPPRSKFNIWHFPIEYRRSPRTRQIVASDKVPYVTREEFSERD